MSSVNVNGDGVVVEGVFRINQAVSLVARFSVWAKYATAFRVSRGILIVTF